MAPMKKRVEKEGGKKKEMITVEVKNGSLGRRQKQVSLDRFLVKVTQKEKESTESSDYVSDNESSPSQ
jgi:hypothetical protein